MKLDMAPRPAAWSRVNRRELWLVAGLTFLALALRAVDVMGRSLWLDDGVTLLRLASSWPDNLLNIIYLYDVPTIDTHPPLYFLLLKAWGVFAGQNEFTLKWFSVVAGVLVVPLSYVLARRMFTPTVGVLAAVTLLLSPAIQWYSHDVRMYTLVVALSALSTYWLCRAVKPKPNDRRPRRRLHAWLLWVGTMFLSVSTHYSFVGLALAHGLFFGLVMLRRMTSEDVAARRRLVRRVAAACGAAVVIAVVLFPLVRTPLARMIAGKEADYHFVPLDVMVASIVDGHTFGMNTVDPTGGLATWVLAGLCVAGVVLPLNGSPADKNSRMARLLLGLSAAGPVLVWFGLSFVKPNFQGVRHLILVLPFLGIMLSRALALALDASKRGRGEASPLRPPAWRRMWAAAGGLGVIALVAIQVYGNLRQFMRTTDWHDDWRGLAHYVRDNWQEGDVLIFGSPIDAATVSLYVPDLDTATPPAREIVAQHRRVWLANPNIMKLHEDDVTHDWLQQHGQLRKRVNFPARTRVIELELFDIESLVYERLPQTARALASMPGGPAHLAGYEIRPGNPRHPLPNLWLSLYWLQGTQNNLQDYSVSLRFSDMEGRVWSDWYVPAELESMPPDMPPGLVYRVDYVIPIPQGLPFQQYRLQFVVRAGAKAEVVQSVEVALSPEEVRCCVRLVRWPAGDPFAPVWSGDGVTLLRVEHEPSIRPGEILPVVLTWRLDKPTHRAWRTMLSFEGVLGGSVVTSTGVTGTDLTPIAGWTAGEPVRDLQSLTLPFSVRPGLYRLSMTLQTEDGRPMAAAQLGAVEVVDFPRTPTATSIPHPLDARVGEMSLLGYGLNQAFTRLAPLDLYTFWRVESDVTRDGVLFLHVIGPDGNLVAQDDNPPEYGKRSTLTYRAGDGIDQLHRFVIPFNSPGGEYRLYAGIYNRGDVVRWPATQNGAPAQDDLVYLGSFELPPLQIFYLPVVWSNGQ